MLVFRCIVVKLEGVSRTGEVGEIFLGEVGVLIVVDEASVDEAPRPEGGELDVNTVDCTGNTVYRSESRTHPLKEDCFVPKLTLFFFLDWLAAILARRALKACRVSRLRGIEFESTGTACNEGMQGGN